MEGERERALCTKKRPSGRFLMIFVLTLISLQKQCSSESTSYTAIKVAPFAKKNPLPLRMCKICSTFAAKYTKSKIEIL